RRGLRRNAVDRRLRNAHRARVEHDRVRWNVDANRDLRRAGERRLSGIDPQSEIVPKRRDAGRELRGRRSGSGRGHGPRIGGRRVLGLNGRGRRTARDGEGDWKEGAAHARILRHWQTTLVTTFPAPWLARMLLS